MGYPGRRAIRTNPRPRSVEAPSVPMRLLRRSGVAADLDYRSSRPSRSGTLRPTTAQHSLIRADGLRAEATRSCQDSGVTPSGLSRSVRRWVEAGASGTGGTTERLARVWVDGYGRLKSSRLAIGQSPNGRRTRLSAHRA